MKQLNPLRAADNDFDNFFDSWFFFEKGVFEEKFLQLYFFRFSRNLSFASNFVSDEKVFFSSSERLFDRNRAAAAAAAASLVDNPTLFSVTLTAACCGGG